MKAKQQYMIYAMREGELIHISRVESGLECKCTCPACGAVLIARKGSVKVHHFAHYEADPCKHGYETALHLAAKQIIAASKTMWIPSVYVRFDSYKRPELVHDAMQIQIDEVVLEKRLGRIIPDICVTSRGKRLLIEILVTHAIGKAKLDRIRSMDASTIEIDLSKIEMDIAEQDFAQVVLGNSKEKCWKYNTLAERWKQRYLQVCEEYPIVEHGLALHAQTCPIASCVWQGRPYANFMDDCTDCRFLIAMKTNACNGSYESIFCCGRARIEHIADFATCEDFQDV